MAISLTNSAAERVRTYLERRGRGVGLRVGVRKTGCSGYAYVIDYADAVDPADFTLQSAGVSVVVDPKSPAQIVPTPPAALDKRRPNCSRQPP